MATEEYSVGYEAGYQEGWNKAIDSIAQPEQEPVAINQHRVPYCADWYDGIPDHPDGHGPYEVRTLYTTPPKQEPRNFCPRCGKRTADLTVIHTCTPPEGGHQ